MRPTTMLQIATVWQGRILAYRLVGISEKVTVGPSPRATFLTPPARGDDQRFLLLAPAKPRGRYRLRVSPAMSGELVVKGETKSIADVLTTGAPSRRDA